jgi:hypothetical protein
MKRSLGQTDTDQERREARLTVLLMFRIHRDKSPDTGNKLQRVHSLLLKRGQNTWENSEPPRISACSAKSCREIKCAVPTVHGVEGEYS